MPGAAGPIGPIGGRVTSPCSHPDCHAEPWRRAYSHGWPLCPVCERWIAPGEDVVRGGVRVCRVHDEDTAERLEALRADLERADAAATVRS